MVFHSLAALTPYRKWLEDLNMRRFPKGLPAWQEIDELSQAPADDKAPVLDRVLESLDSAWNYFKPWPERATRRKLTSWEEKGKYVLCWLTSRLDFFENLVGFSESWPMFSPSVATGKVVARSVLKYQDGSTRVVRLSIDPEDLTRYSRWFNVCIVNYEVDVAKDEDTRLGYCNLLAHRFATNDRGQPLAAIYTYKVEYSYPAPDEDAVAVLESQNGPNGPPQWDSRGPFFVYDVDKKAGRSIPLAQRKSIQRQLDQRK